MADLANAPPETLSSNSAHDVLVPALPATATECLDQIKKETSPTIVVPIVAPALEAMQSFGAYSESPSILLKAVPQSLADSQRLCSIMNVNNESANSSFVTTTLEHGFQFKFPTTAPLLSLATIKRRKTAIMKRHIMAFKLRQRNDHLMQLKSARAAKKYPERNATIHVRDNSFQKRYNRDATLQSLDLSNLSLCVNSVNSFYESLDSELTICIKFSPDNLSRGPFCKVNLFSLDAILPGIKTHKLHGLSQITGQLLLLSVPEFCQTTFLDLARNHISAQINKLQIYFENPKTAVFSKQFAEQLYSFIVSFTALSQLTIRFDSSRFIRDHHLSESLCRAINELEQLSKFSISAVDNLYENNFALQPAISTVETFCLGLGTTRLSLARLFESAQCNLALRHFGLLCDDYVYIGILMERYPALGQHVTSLALQCSHQAVNSADFWSKICSCFTRLEKLSIENLAIFPDTIPDCIFKSTIEMTHLTELTLIGYNFPHLADFPQYNDNWQLYCFHKITKLTIVGHRDREFLGKFRQGNKFRLNYFIDELPRFFPLLEELYIAGRVVDAESVQSLLSIHYETMLKHFDCYFVEHDDNMADSD